VAIENGALHFEGMRLDLDPQGAFPGPARLFVRSDEMIVGPPDGTPFRGIVKRLHGIGAARRAEIDLANTHTIEVQTPNGCMAGDLVGLRPRRYRVYPAS
jgi:hypothetical protein